ncbi:MAG: YihY/virulence factor BrkB family protein [Actinobacteria bacterium]|nr:YihY/virulence factor BrkB family protein [Actinomycetota bacterium]
MPTAEPTAPPIRDEVDDAHAVERPVAPRRHRAWKLTVAVTKRAFHHQSTGAASQFAYNAFIATVPFLFVLVAAISKSAGRASYERISNEFDAAVPIELKGSLLRSLTIAERNAAATTVALAVGLVVSLYLIGNAVGSLTNAVDAANHVPHRSWIRGRLVAIALSVAAAVLVLTTTAVLIVGSDLTVDVLDAFGQRGAARFLALATYPIAIVGLAGFVLILYRFGPSRRTLRLRELLPGAAFAVGAWLGATQLFGAYTQKFNTYEVIYGSFGIIVVYLIFLYLSGLVIILGAEINSVLADRRRGRPDDWEPVPRERA